MATMTIMDTINALRNNGSRKPRPPPICDKETKTLKDTNVVETLESILETT